MNKIKKWVLAHKNGLIIALIALSLFVYWLRRRYLNENYELIINDADTVMNAIEAAKTGTDLRGRTDLPRGLRNNNPGNLIRTSIAWKGKVPHSSNTDSRFEQFISLPYGIRAMILDVRGKIRRGLNTIELFMPVYAPPSENNTESYITSIATRAGYARNKVLTGSVDELLKIIPAMMFSENGSPVGTYATDSSGKQVFTSPYMADIKLAFNMI